MYLDTHCHLDFDSLHAELPAVMGRANAAGVSAFVVPGVSPDGWGNIRKLAAGHRSIMPAFGIHPLLAHLADDVALDELASYLESAVAVGEIGLDYAVPQPARPVQLSAFRRQLRMAVDRGLPVLVHCRRGFADLLEIFREEHAERVGGIMHAFSGSPETARECIRLGFYISVCGTVTYSNAVRPVRVAREITLDRLVLETDAPDLSPEPFRGRVNEPAYLPETARALGALKGVSLSRVAEITTENALNALKLTRDCLVNTWSS